MTGDDLPADLEECNRLGRAWVARMRTGAPQEVFAMYEGVRDAVRDNDTLSRINILIPFRTLAAWTLIGLVLGFVLGHFL